MSGGNGNPTSGYEANERCAADHATRPAAHRVDHTSISAAPDDLRSRSGHAQLQCTLTQSMFACIAISMLTSQCCLLCGVSLFESVCACMSVDSAASMFASNQTACQRKKTSPDENLCSSPVKPTTTPHTRLARALRSSLKITSASFARRFVLDSHGEAGICSNNGKL